MSVSQAQCSTEMSNVSETKSLENSNGNSDPELSAKRALPSVF